MNQHLPILFLCALPLASGLTAQQSFTSPLGQDNLEGNSDFATFFTPRRFQQIDATQIGRPSPIQRLAFRRNGTFTGSNSLARTATMTVTMGHGDYAQLDPVFDNNYRGVPAMTVFLPKTVNIPDWTQLPPVAPAPFDLTLAFDQTFIYDGVQALVFDVIVENLSRSGDMYVDRVNLSNIRNSGTQLGTGCTATGRTATFSHFLAMLTYAPDNPTYSLRLEHSGSNAPSSAPVSLVLGVVDPMLAVPGLCSTLRTLPLIELPRSPSSASGFLATEFIDLPMDPAFAGAVITSQYASPDMGQPGLPLAVSSGRSTVVPAAPPVLRCAYHFASPSSPSATVFSGMGVIVQLGF